MAPGDPDSEPSTDGGTMRLALVVLALVVLVPVVLTAPAAGAVSVVDGTEAAVNDADEPVVPERADAPITGCFVGEGYPLTIGTGSATIDAVVHASVLTDPAAGDEFGVELAGSVDRDPIVTLAAGVRFDAPGLIETGVNPFAAFDLVYTYELRLPMFDGAIGDSEFREDRAPVGSAAGTVPC